MAEGCATRRRPPPDGETSHLHTSDTLHLLQKAKEGNRSAFNALFRRHRPRLTALVATRMSPGLRAYTEAQDIVQEAYVEAARKFADFTPEVPQAFYRWLTRIAGFKLKEAERNRRAKKRGQPGRLAGEPPAQQTSVAGRAGEGERTRQIARALDQLPEAQGQAVRLRYLQGLSLAETALRLDRSESAVKALVSRGLASLSRLMLRPAATG